MSDSATPWPLSSTISRSLLKLTSVESVTLPNHLILCCPLLLWTLIFPSIRVFSNESAFHIRGPKYWSFSFSNSHSSEYSGLISFRMDWFALLAVQGTLHLRTLQFLKYVNKINPPERYTTNATAFQLIGLSACFITVAIGV